jgi:hypothetical protein
LFNRKALPLPGRPRKNEMVAIAAMSLECDDPAFNSPGGRSVKARSIE